MSVRPYYPNSVVVAMMAAQKAAAERDKNKRSGPQLVTRGGRLMESYRPTENGGMYYRFVNPRRRRLKALMARIGVSGGRQKRKLRKRLHQLGQV